MDSGLGTLDSGSWGRDPGFGILDAGSWGFGILDPLDSTLGPRAEVAFSYMPCPGGRRIQVAISHMPCPGGRKISK